MCPASSLRPQAGASLSCAGWRWTEKSFPICSKSEAQGADFEGAPLCGKAAAQPHTHARDRGRLRSRQGFPLLWIRGKTVDQVRAEDAPIPTPSRRSGFALSQHVCLALPHDLRRMLAAFTHLSWKRKNLSGAPDP